MVNFRRIVHRGLVNYSGELWYREGLPSDVFRRLVVRKENETPLDRFSGDYEELMTYANFRDLADIIVGNGVLRDRLTILEPRDGAGLLDRLHELEEIKRSASSGQPINDEDAARLERYFDEFRMAIKKGKAASPAPKPASPSTAAEEDEAAAEEETLDSIFDEEESPPQSATPRPGRLVVKVSADGLRKAASEPEPESEAEPEPEAEPNPEIEPQPEPEPVPAAPPPPLVHGDVGSMETPVTLVSEHPGQSDDQSQGPVEAAEGVERAIRDEDHAAILRALHVEVTEIADGMLRRDPKQGHFVWGQVKKRGWFEAHREEFDLDPLERFYSLADDYLDSFASEAKSSELKAILAEVGFSKMLLELREMFLNSRAKV